MKILRALRAVFDDVVADTAAMYPESTGWATASLLRATRRVALFTAAGWQLVMCWAVLATLGVSGGPLMLGQFGLAILALVSIRHKIPAAVVPLGMAALGLWSYLASADINSALVFAACWQINFSSCAAGLLIFRRYVLLQVTATAVLISTTLMVALPAWGVQFAVSIVITQISIIVALRLGVLSLLRAAARADTATRAAEAATRAVRRVRHQSKKIAEESRVLHDTAINTLGAIANGTSEQDVEQVRSQCARDVVLLQSLRSAAPMPKSATLHDIFHQPGLPTQRLGLGDAEINKISDSLSSSTIDGVVGCVREAVTNATKHSGSDRIQIEVAATRSHLSIVVRDFGIGFTPGPSTGRGIEASIIGRAQDHGFAAHVSSVVGEQTEVRLSISLDPEDADAHKQTMPDLTAEQASMGALHQRAGELWALGVTIVSIALTFAGSMRLNPTSYLMIMVMISMWAAAKFLPYRRMEKSFSALLVLATCLIFFLSAAATDFGTKETVHWQALAPTGAFVLLISLHPKRWVLSVGATLWALVIAAMAGSMLPTSSTAALIVVVAGCVGLGFSGVWSTFQIHLTRFARETLHSQKETFESQLSVELETAAQESYLRWLDAGLDTAILLLTSIAEGARAPYTAETRTDCDNEERHLRQLLQISPELIHLGHQLIPTLQLARARNINYQLRLGTTDAPNEQSARDIASAIRSNLASAEQGARITASLFPMNGGLQLTLLGPGLKPPDDLSIPARLEQLGSLSLLELTYAGSPTEISH